MKFNPDGTQLLYATYLGGSDSDEVSALTVDAAGSAYVTGYAVSTDFPTTPHSYQPRHIGTCGGQAGGDAYVTKFSPSAARLQYSTLIGGSCAQIPTGIALDATGSAYISGATVSPDFPVTKGALQPTFGGQTDGFLAEVSPAGDALVFSTYLGGQNSDVAAGVSVDAGGSIYVAGNGNGFSFAPAPPTSQLQCDGSLVTYGGLSLSVQAPPYYLKLAPGGSAISNPCRPSPIAERWSRLSRWIRVARLGWAESRIRAITIRSRRCKPSRQAATSFGEYAPDAKTTVFSTLLDGFQSMAVSGAAYVRRPPATLHEDRHLGRRTRSPSTASRSTATSRFPRWPPSADLLA